MAKKDSNRTIVNGVDSFSVNIMDNGFTLEYTGNNSDNDWVNTKLVVTDVNALCEKIREVVQIPRA